MNADRLTDHVRPGRDGSRRELITMMIPLLGSLTDLFLGNSLVLFV
jgi:hypothetical protein